MTKTYLSLMGLFLGLGYFLYAQYTPPLTISPSVAHHLGMQIWQNECRQTQTGLTTWNPGEEFASLGIGHFIWYPTNTHGSFKETFPALLQFFKTRGLTLPSWMDNTSGCPWETREDFEAAQASPSLQELRHFLAEHLEEQILFMVQRLHHALPQLLKQASSQQHVTFQFYRLASTPAGLYVLLDYLNFKGEGIAAHEEYQGHRWGLLQVLEQMKGTAFDQSAVEEFIEVAKIVLATRVQQAPAERKEQRWLKGWYNRLETYRHFHLPD